MAPQRRGRVSAWKDDKGFGFITPEEGGKEIFFHVSGIAAGRDRMREHAAVTYTLAHDDQRGPRAVNVRSGSEPLSPVALSAACVGIFFCALAFLMFRGEISPLISVIYIVFSAVTFGAYNIDKSNAVAGQRRIPESTLHLLELCGGWPGALVAQWYYRHKNRKTTYQVVYWGIVALHLIAFVVYLLVV